jgi:hypothetical protein
MGTAEHGALSARFNQGVKDYAFGGHPVWELFRFAYQMSRQPILLGGLALGSGYLWAAVRRLERPIPPEMIAFRRNEQMQRLRNLLFKANNGPIASEGFPPTAGCEPGRRSSLF